MLEGKYGKYFVVIFIIILTFHNDWVSFQIGKML